MPKRYEVLVEWDAYGEELLELPKGKFCVELPDKYIEQISEDYDEGDTLVDYLTDLHDFCINSLSFWPL